MPSETSGVMWSVSANEQMAASCPSRWAARLKSDRLSIAVERCNRRTALILECPATAMAADGEAGTQLVGNAAGFRRYPRLRAWYRSTATTGTIDGPKKFS